MKRIITLILVSIVLFGSLFIYTNNDSLPTFENAVETTEVNEENTDLIISNSIYSWWISPHYLEDRNKKYFTWVNNNAEPHLGILENGEFVEEKLGDYDSVDDRDLYLTREEDGIYYLEKWSDGGVDVLESTEYPTKLFRPISFDDGVMWIEGVYQTYNEFETQINYVE